MVHLETVDEIVCYIFKKRHLRVFKMFTEVLIFDLKYLWELAYNLKPHIYYRYTISSYISPENKIGCQ